MNRRNFLSKLAIGTAAVAVAPKVLIPKEPDLMTKIINLKPSRTPLDTIIEHLEMQKKLMSDIAAVPMSRLGGFQDYEHGLLLQMQESMERTFLFGKRRKLNTKFYSGGIWTTSL